jgi:hypothetical protein
MFKLFKILDGKRAGKKKMGLGKGVFTCSPSCEILFYENKTVTS